MKYLLGAFIALVLFACDSDVCNQRTAWPVQTGFYHVPDTLVLTDSVSVWGLNNDSVIVSNKKVNKIEFSLATQASPSIFVFKIKSTYDTLTVYHSNTPYLISKVCGYGYEQKIDSIHFTKHTFTNITWEVPQVDKNDKENVQIYY
ncbi:MAG: DUF6452 family protein [Flavobacteriales bacterium]